LIRLPDTIVMDPATAMLLQTTKSIQLIIAITTGTVYGDNFAMDVRAPPHYPKLS